MLRCKCVAGVVVAAIAVSCVGCVSRAKYDTDMMRAQVQCEQAVKEIATAMSVAKGAQSDVEKRTAELAAAQARVTELSGQLVAAKEEAAKAAATAKTQLDAAKAVNAKQADVVRDLQKQIDAVRAALTPIPDPAAPAPNAPK